MGRTKGSKNGKYGAVIDKAQFEKLCSILCTEEEICGYFNVSHDTLNRWCRQEYKMTFTETFNVKCVIGKISLRRIQFKQAETNPSMAIFLGKQILGQKDVVENQNVNKIEVVNDVPDVAISEEIPDDDETK